MVVIWMNKRLLYKRSRVGGELDEQETLTVRACGKEAGHLYLLVGPFSSRQH